MLKVAGNNLLHIFLGNKVSLDCEQTCDAYNAYDGAYGIRVVNNNVSGNCKHKNLQNVCGGEVYKHAYKLESDYYAEYAFKEMLAVSKMLVNSEVGNEYSCHLGKE